MQFNKKGLLFPLLAFTELCVIIYLLPANYESSKTCKNQAPAQEQNPQWEPPKVHRATIAKPDCTKDNDCPSDSFCLKGECHVSDYVAESDTVDAGEDPTSPRYCESAEDCGCGYQCLYNECHKLDSSCCANADCEPDLICVKDNGELNGKCIISECDSAADCGNQCNMYCNNHRCFESSHCCTNADCENGSLCAIFEGAPKGYCLEPKCFSDADCGCGYACEIQTHQCVSYSPDHPISCCGTDVYHNGSCYSHEAIEDGNCLEDKNCPAGNFCYEGEYEDKCLPAKCTKNADCGCGAGCWDGRCELGCNDNSACCDPDYPVCKHGECINPYAENEDE